MLWGCSSGALREMGEFDRVGTPYHYMVAGWWVLGAADRRMVLTLEWQPGAGGELVGRDGPGH